MVNLFGFISVKKHFSSGEWLNHVKRKIKECQKRRRIPILVGGTGLYFSVITKGISKIPAIDKKTRHKVRELFRVLGYKKFYKKLISLDPKVKSNIHINYLITTGKNNRHNIGLNI